MAYGDSPHDAALQTAWHAFCDHLRDAGDQVFKDHNPADPLRAPLVISSPGEGDYRATLTTPCDARDILPTAAALAGARRLPAGLLGQSLLPLPPSDVPPDTAP